MRKQRSKQTNALSSVDWSRITFSPRAKALIAAIVSRATEQFWNIQYMKVLKVDWFTGSVSAVAEPLVNYVNNLNID